MGFRTTFQTIRRAFLFGIAPFLALLIVHCAHAPRLPRLSYQCEKTLPIGWGDDPVIILQDSVQLFVEKNGIANFLTMKNVLWYRIQKETPNVIKTMYVYDHDSIELKPSISVQIYYPNGSREILSSRHIIRKRYIEKGTLAYNKYVNNNNLFISEIMLPRYRKGSIVRVNIDRRFIKPEFVTTIVMRNNYNTLDKVVSVYTSAKASIATGIINGENLPIDTDQTVEGPWSRRTIHGLFVPKLGLAYGIRNPEQWYCGLYFSIPPYGDKSFTWKQLGDWYLNLIHNSCNNSARIDSITHCFSNAPKDSLIQRAFNWVRDNIRYYGSWEKMYGWVPRCANEVVNRGYGDCKEMAMVLKEILCRNGQPADLVLVSTPGEFQLTDAYPGFDGVNHAIVYASRGKEEFFLDPTEKFRGIIGSTYNCIGRKAFVLRKESSFFMNIAPSRHYRNRILTQCEISQSGGEGNWQLHGTVRLVGRCAQDLYEKIMDSPNEKTGPLCESILKTAFHIDVSRVESPSASNDSISIGFTADFKKNYLAVEKGGLMVNMPSLYSPVDLFGDCGHEGARFAYELQQRDEWSIPRGFETFDYENRSNPYYSIAWKRNGTTITRDYENPFLSIEPASLPQYCKALKEKETYAEATLRRTR